jgi:FixJ family two-component response regulator
MNGQDLAGTLLPQYPHLKCLFMSGYTSDIIAKQGILTEGIQFIQKPFSKNDLADKVRMVLEKSEQDIH